MHVLPQADLRVTETRPVGVNPQATDQMEEKPAFPKSFPETTWFIVISPPLNSFNFYYFYHLFGPRQTQYFPQLDCKSHEGAEHACDFLKSGPYFITLAQC